MKHDGDRIKRYSGTVGRVREVLWLAGRMINRYLRVSVLCTNKAGNHAW